MEIWKSIEGYSIYEASSLGRIRRVKDGLVYKPALCKNGYMTVALCADGQKRKSVLVHRIVLLAFKGRCPDGMEALHSNGCRTDNSETNLRWGTKSENTKDAMRHGTYKSNWRAKRGESNSNAKLSSECVARIREASLFGANSYQLAPVFNVSSSYIRMLVRGEWRTI